MDEEFIFQVTEEELAQFPEEGNQTEKEQNPQENKQGSEPRKEIPKESTEKQDKENSKIKYTFTIESQVTHAVCCQQKWPV